MNPENYIFYNRTPYKYIVKNIGYGKYPHRIIPKMILYYHFSEREIKELPFQVEINKKYFYTVLPEDGIEISKNKTYEVKLIEI